MPNASKSKPWFSSLLVLVVDDCPFQRVLTGMLLGRWGVTPITAPGGSEAIRLEACQDFDLILMDIEMPGMDGFEATLRIREAQTRRKRPRPVPVIAYTAVHLPLFGEQMKQSGMNDALQKPCDASAMRDCLARWCPDRALLSFAPLKNAAHA